jgi:hypothetical protein
VALSYRSSSAANGGAATVATITPTLPTGWAANDIVYFCISIGVNFTAPVNPSGWTTRNDLNSDSTGRTIFAYRTMQNGDAAPTFSWTTAGKWAWTGICVQPTAGQAATHLTLSGPTVNATNTTHTSPALSAGASTGCSVLLTGYRGGANAATAITTTPPTNWTEPATNADTSTATGTTSALRQVASWHAYRSGQTGNITPGAQTVSATAVANLYHAFAVETSPFLPDPPLIVQQAAITRANYW